jgi:hypothetical protein
MKPGLRRNRRVEMSELDPVTQHKIEWMIDSLCSEFDGRCSRAEITDAMLDCVDRLAASATVLDYVPLMAQRFTRERLQAAPAHAKRPALRAVSWPMQAA